MYLSINKIVTSYENTINNDYSIVLVSSTPLIKSTLVSNSKIDIKSINHLKREDILKNFKNDVSEGTYKLLEKKLPYFYTINLENFPTSSKLKEIKYTLEHIKGIKKVETFSKNHDNVYSLFLLIKTVVTILFICIIIFTFLLMINNVKIWFFEHSNRLTIIKLHGGSIYYGAKPIINIAIISSIISSIFVILVVYFLKENLAQLLKPELLSVVSKNLTPFTNLEIASVFIISLVISFITVFGILLKHRLK
jgi:cell division transport system permease protein